MEHCLVKVKGEREWEWFEEIVENISLLYHLLWTEIINTWDTGNVYFISS